MNLVHVDELDAIKLSHGFVWRPVRRHFGIRAFGTNAYTPGTSGQVVEEHTERLFEHEEIYLVLRGRVRFTIDGDEHVLGQGQLVFVRDPALRRGAVALTEDAAVLAVGGKPGEPHRVSSWEYSFLASRHLRAGRYDEAKEPLLEGLDAEPGNAYLAYDLACAEALAGETDAALEHLSQAVGAEPELRESARADSDLDAIRDDPRFPG